MGLYWLLAFLGVGYLCYWVISGFLAESTDASVDPVVEEPEPENEVSVQKLIVINRRR